MVDDFGFPDSDKLMFHINEAMCWKSVRNHKQMKGRSPLSPVLYDKNQLKILLGNDFLIVLNIIIALWRDVSLPVLMRGRKSS